MTTLTQKLIDAGFSYTSDLLSKMDCFERLLAAEREAMIADGWRHCAQGQRTTQFCGQLEAAVAAEREECAKCVETLTCDGTPKECFETAAAYIRGRAAIRARGQE